MIDIISNIGHVPSSPWKIRLLIREAARAGANTISLDAYHIMSTNTDKVMLDQMQEIISLCKKSNLVLLVTPRQAQAVRTLSTLGIDRYGVFPSDIDYTSLLEALGETHKPVSLRVGVSTNDEILSALSMLRRTEVNMLHTVIGFPPSPKSANMSRILDLISDWQLKSKDFFVPIGLSSGLREWWVDVACAVLKPICIEKPLTLGWPLGNLKALNPKEFKSFVRAVRDVELAMAK